MIKLPRIMGKGKKPKADKAPTPFLPPEDKPRQASPERRELIRQALKTRRSKAHVLDDLSREEREKLYVVALKTLMPDDK